MIVLPPATIQVDQGVRSLAIDSKDDVVLVVNESTGGIAEVSLDSNQVTARIMAVLPEHGEGDNGADDYSDRDSGLEPAPHHGDLTRNRPGKYDSDVA